MMTYIKFSIIFTLTAILTACVTMPVRQTALNQRMSWAERQRQLNNINAWQVKGSVGGHTAHKAFTANVVWQQQKNNFYHIRLFGPLGIDTTEISGDNNQVVLTTANNERITASNPDLLIMKVLGWELPVSNLYYWIRGLPAPNTVHTYHFDKYHHLTYLQQHGWKVQYLQYIAVNGKVDLPSKIFIHHHNLNLRLVISQWIISKKD